MSLEKLHVAVIQCNSSENWEINFTQIEALISQLPDPTDLIVLPESAFYRGHQRREYSINLRDKHPLLEKLRSLTKKRKGWILAGTVLEEHPSRRYFQTSILLNRKGEIVALYRKTHLFRVTLEDGTIIDEQLFYSPGNEYILVEIDGWHAGLSICYDLRFPEIFRSYRKAGAEIFLLVANFTQGNSPDHWITLNRARAIENQCFMVS
ncbi:MAG: nitrilase-related carbon-nitrogen hydrolase, partial [Candidatus Bathyarchaeia archaeon]